MGAQGTTTIDFGAWPGKPVTSVDVTGQTGIGTGSLVEVWILPADTSDHTSDEHLVDPPIVRAGPPVAATGFTIYGLSTPITVATPNDERMKAATGQGEIGARDRVVMIWGKWNVAWVWN